MLVRYSEYANSPEVATDAVLRYANSNGIEGDRVISINIVLDTESQGYIGILVYQE